MIHCNNVMLNLLSTYVISLMEPPSTSYLNVRRLEQEGEGSMEPL